MPSSIIFRAPTMSLEGVEPGRANCGRPPATRMSAGRAQCRGLVDGAPVVVARRYDVLAGGGNSPPRQ